MQRRGLSLFGRALSGARRGNRGTAQGPGDEVRGRVDADSEAGLDAEGGHAPISSGSSSMALSMRWRNC